MRAAVALLVLLAAGPATALPLLPKHKQGGNGGDGFVPGGRTQPDDEPRAAEGRSARDAARDAQARNGGGRVLSVEPATDGWRVKLLKDGDVRFVFVPN